jgi:hypothetical protein
MTEPWTKEQFEDHWYSVMPSGMIGVAVPCDCGDEHCHGWRMKVTHFVHRDGDLHLRVTP